MNIWQKIIRAIRACFGLDDRADVDTPVSLPVPEPAADKPVQQEPMADESVQPEPVAEKPVLPEPLPFELDLDKLDYIRSRRKILDWRDDFAAQMLQQGGGFFRQFTDHVKERISQLGLLDCLFPEPALKVLSTDFSMLVQAPFEALAESERNRLAEILPFESFIELPSLSLSSDVVAGLLSFLEDFEPSFSEKNEIISKLEGLEFGFYNKGEIFKKLKFEFSDQEKIISEFNGLVFGHDGMVDHYLKQAYAVSQSLLHELDKRHDYENTF